jgi:exodeoxyribonuclease VII large subunit
MNEYTVSELNKVIKDVIDDKMEKRVKLKCEISSIKKSGKHAYLTVKDSDASISAAYWNCGDILHKDGDKVVITGRVDYYRRNGNMNFICEEIEAVGIGELYKEYQANYKKFDKLGYFDNKIDLPETINSIGILTAKDGAALQDVLYVLNNNGYRGNVYVYNCIVQGSKCPNSITEGIKFFEKNLKDYPVDLLLMTRGGGSFEDLIGFSDPKIIEKIHKCKLYTISAIGHEVDNMLSDFVANCRVPTPSVAGKVISEQYNKKNKFIDDMEEYLNHSLLSDINKLDISLHKLYRLQDKLPSIDKNIDNEIEYLTELDSVAYSHIKDNITHLLEKTNILKTKLHDNLHDEILKKGYTLLVNEKGKIIKNKKKLKKAEKITMCINGEELNVKITIIENE